MREEKLSQVAERLGIGPETLRYYERIGLVQSPSRTQGGHRTYSKDDIRKLSFIKRARDLGFSINEIRLLIEFSKPEQFSCEEVQKVAQSRLNWIRDKLNVLHEAERLLSESLARCPTTSSSCCPVLSMLGSEPQPEQANPAS